VRGCDWGAVAVGTEQATFGGVGAYSGGVATITEQRAQWSGFLSRNDVTRTEQTTLGTSHDP